MAGAGMLKHGLTWSHGMQETSRAASWGPSSGSGAIELGYILDTLLGVSSKVLTVSSGAEIPSKAREIAHHFDTQV